MSQLGTVSTLYNPVTGKLEEAKLDVSTRDAVTGQLIHVDWSVACEHSTYDPRRRARSNKDGLAAANRVDEKRTRYPPSGGEPVPAVPGSGGRPCDKLVILVKSYGKGLSVSDRSEVIGGMWRGISRTLQLGNAEMVLGAVGT